ncbi:MAG: UDP-N-acetylmuramoyl-L-alanine--D-glutamate ligase [Firmicutes bacterium]|nr:UDP-N-acetylmuramoyl-L-alanine--D-glutamate ligase [Bacillota bacterium]
MKKIIEMLQNKKIVILGFGKEGRSTFEYIRKNLPLMPLTVMDQNYKNIVLDDENAEVIDVNYDSLSSYDLIFKAPGVSLKDVNIEPFKDKITSQLQMFLETTKGYTIGVTGSKGKSTTSSLIYQMINDQGYKSFLVGNIGKPILDVIDNIDEDTYVVIEMSSHQLEFVKNSPNISLILNLFPEHLDHYRSLDAYYKAKLNIANFQKKEDYFIYSTDNADLKKYIEFVTGEAEVFDLNAEKKDNSYAYINENYIVVDDEKIFDTTTDIKLKGNHNLKDIMFALSVASLLNLDYEKCVKTIEEFEPLSHRMELVGTYNDIIFYNDSIATIPDAAINAIKSLGNVNTLIIGGMDRGIDYSGFVDFLNSCDVENIICMPETGTKLMKDITKKTYEAMDVETAVDIAKKVTKKNTICLLSPAASSYGFYSNFEERGNRYKEHIKKEN